MSCNFCNETIYVKTIRHTMPLLAPLTEVEELEHKLLNLTGEQFIPLPQKFCPVCGERIEQKEWKKENPYIQARRKK